MAWTIIARDLATGRRGLLVEVHPDTGDAQALAPALQRRLFDRSMRVGLVITPATMLVVRDLLTDTSFTSNRFDVQQLPTAELFSRADLGVPRAGQAFYDQVRGWLEAVGSSWYSFLAPAATPLMVPDVVGHLAEANLEEWEGLLNRGDAA